jgi:uncharacterized membrane protein
MNFNFGEVLTRAWKIVWKHKVLWIFGVLASCNTNRGSVNYNNSMNFQNDAATLPPQMVDMFEQLAKNIVPILAILAAVICVMALVSVFLGTMGRIGLIRGTFAAEGGAEKLTFGPLFSESLPFFWRSFWLWLLVGLPFVVLSLVLAGLLVLGVLALIGDGSNQAAVLGMLGMLPVMLICFCIIGLLSWIVRLVAQQAQNALVLDDVGTIPALRRGWDVFKANLGSVILMSIILGIIGFVVNLILVMPLMMVMFPTMMAFIAGQGESFTPLIVFGVCLAAFLPISLLVGGVFSSYYESAWTLTYLRLTRKPEELPTLVDTNV